MKSYRWSVAAKREAVSSKEELCRGYSLSSGWARMHIHRINAEWTQRVVYSLKKGEIMDLGRKGEEQGKLKRQE